MKQYIDKLTEIIFFWKRKNTREDFQQWSKYGRMSELLLAVVIAFTIGLVFAFALLK